MENRDTFLIDLRGEALGTITEQSSSEEIFQNKILRPILRLQNELFIQVFLNYAVNRKMFSFP